MPRHLAVKHRHRDLWLGCKLHPRTALLRGSWVISSVISRVISGITIVMTFIGGLITPLVTTHEHPRRVLCISQRTRGAFPITILLFRVQCKGPLSCSEIPAHRHTSTHTHAHTHMILKPRQSCFFANLMMIWQALDSCRYVKCLYISVYTYTHIHNQYMCVYIHIYVDVSGTL